ncbi:MAG: PAS domain S-box protein [bacterium]|nr:PAS domain S-box protein [bacterium]
MDRAQKIRRELLNENQVLRSRVRELEAAARAAEAKWAHGGSDPLPRLDTPRDSGEIYRAIVDDTPLLFFRCRSDGVILHMNQLCCEYFGRTPEESIGANVFDLLPEPKQKALLGSLSAPDIERPTQTFEYSSLDETGEVRWQRWTNRALFDSQGRVTAYQSIGEDITERKRAERDGRSNVPNYRALFDGSITAAYVFDANKNFVDTNQAGLDLLGYSREELLRLRISNVTEDLELICPEHRELLGGTTTMNGEHRLKHKGGSTIDVLGNSMPLTDADGNFVGMQCTLTDITDRKRAETSPWASEAWLLSLFRNAPYAIVTGRLIRNAEGRAVDFVHLMANAATATHTGLDPEQLVGTTAGGFAASDDVERLVQRYAQVVETGVPIRFEADFRASGPVLDVTAFHLSGDDFIVSFFDMSERVRAEERLQTSKQRLRTIIDAVPSMIFVKNAEGRFLAANKAVAEAYGMQPRELVGKRFTDVYPDIDAANEIMENARQVLQSGREMTVPAKNYVDSTGATRCLQTVIVACSETDFGEPAVLSVSMDVSELEEGKHQLALHRDHLEEMVAERTRELEASEAALLQSERLASLGTLAAGMAHQINNPLGAILNGAQFGLLSEDSSDVLEVWKETLIDIERQTKRCGRIVRSILQFSRDEPTEKWTADASEVARRSCGSISGYAAQCGAEVLFEPALADAPVWMSPIELEQALVNLMRNGVESGTRAGVVTMRVQNTPTMVRIEVQDNGRGISQEELKHIFDPFFTTRLHEGGTGLGLSVTHGIVLDHRGTIAVESELGVGTTFSIELPLALETSA